MNDFETTIQFTESSWSFPNEVMKICWFADLSITDGAIDWHEPLKDATISTSFAQDNDLQSYDTNAESVRNCCHEPSPPPLTALTVTTRR